MPGPSRIDELQTLEVRIESGLQDLALDRSRPRVGHEHLDREQVFLRQENDSFSIRAQDRRDIEATAPQFGRDHHTAILIRPKGLGDHRIVGGERRLLPLRDQRIGRNLQYRSDSHPHIPRLAGDLEYFTHNRITPSPGDVGPEGVAVAVRVEGTGVIRQLAERRHGPPARRVMHPHRCKWINGSQRHVLGHPLSHPKRQRQHGGEATTQRLARSAGYVELERVHHLMAKNVICLTQRSSHRQDDTPFERLRYAACGFVDGSAQRRGLLEIRVVGIEDNRLTRLHLMVEQPCQPFVPALCHACRQLDGFALLGVVVDVEVFSLENAKIKRVVLNLVAPEILCLGRGHPRSGHRRHRRQRRHKRDNASTDSIDFHQVLQSPAAQRHLGAVEKFPKIASPKPTCERARPAPQERATAMPEARGILD